MASSNTCSVNPKRTNKKSFHSNLKSFCLIPVQIMYASCIQIPDYGAECHRAEN